ncbi:eukaryotic translation initiation factor 2A [Cricetulus griseus]
MAPSTPLLTVRGSEGLYMVNGPPHFTESTVLPRESGKNCKVYTFSKDGTLFAWNNGEKVNILNVTNKGLLHSFDVPKAVCLEFSPNNTVLATWQPYTTSKDGTAGVPNLQLYDVKTGTCLKSFIQKKMQNWCPSWSDDEIICARNVNNEVHFFENNNFTSTDVDKTGASYYGEQTLHYIATNGESAVVQLPKNGPIYDVVWNSSSTEFCAVYGFMPAKATVFNLKCDPVFDFGTGPRNAAFYSPHGHILVLAGFGNLRGQMEHEDEPPQNMKPHPGSDKPLSKTALKNQRKHEAKKAAKQEARSDSASTPVIPQSVPRNTITQSVSGDPEVDKKIKNLKKKLKAIEQLKEQAASGKQLEKNQLEKIQKETALLRELEDLELGI